MTALTLTLAASAIPSIPLVWAHYGVVNAITNAVLVLCVVALWLQRERTRPVQHPVPFGREERFAA